jgi:tetrahydromethanopterin S-methyltransferase subunit C
MKTIQGGQRRRARTLAVVLTGLSLVFTGCENAGQGALSGGAVGALGGLAIGSLSGNAGAGAAIGAIAGSVGGAVIGDQNRRANERQRDMR